MVMVPTCWAQRLILQRTGTGGFWAIQQVQKTAVSAVQWLHKTSMCEMDKSCLGRQQTDWNRLFTYHVSCLFPTTTINWSQYWLLLHQCLLYHLPLHFEHFSRSTCWQSLKPMLPATIFLLKMQHMVNLVLPWIWISNLHCSWHQLKATSPNIQEMAQISLCWYVVTRQRLIAWLDLSWRLFLA